jgi:hypothetical protein
MTFFLILYQHIQTIGGWGGNEEGVLEYTSSMKLQGADVLGAGGQYKHLSFFSFFRSF